MRRKNVVVNNDSAQIRRVDDAASYNPNVEWRASYSPCRRCNVKRIFSALALALIFGYDSLNPLFDELALPTLQRTGFALHAPMGSIVYGAKSKGGDTAKLVTQAIQSGFRHIATGGFHSEYNENGVGIGWKESGIPRQELYLQTLFVARSVNGYGSQNCNLRDDSRCRQLTNATIEEQVHLSIESSLRNLQTNYIDAVLVHNFRAKLQPYDETIQVWRVLEEYVSQGIIRHLGIVSCHDKDYLFKLVNDTKIKPSIIQNRFHSNRQYDIELRPFFKQWGMANQLFWILTGSAGGKTGSSVIAGIAEKMGKISPKILLYSLTMELGGTPMIGTKSISHMQEDVDALVKNRMNWAKEDLYAVAEEIHKSLLQ